MEFAVEKEEDIIADVEHPVVTRHNETGRNAIFISETFTNGIVWDRRGSQAVQKCLRSWIPSNSVSAITI